MNPTLALLTAAALAWSGLTESHDPAEPTHAGPSAQSGNLFVSSMAEQERTYYLELFGQTAKVCALPYWRDLNRAVLELFSGQFAQPQAQALYDKIAQSLPVLQVNWDGTKACLVSVPPLTLAAGLERCVLIEVRNSSSVPHVLRAQFAGARESNAAVTRPGAKRGLVAQLVEVNQSATLVTVAIKSGQGMDSLSVPVSVVPPARIIGFLIDSDQRKLTAGRVSVLGGDGLLRHAKAFEKNATLSSKLILKTPTQQFMYKLPFFYADRRFEIDVHPGNVELMFERGFEHPLARMSVSLDPGETREVTMASGRFLNMRAQGWISGETHVHWVTNAGNENEDIGLLGMVQKAEDLQVINNLTYMTLGIVKPDHYPMGPIPGYTSGEYLMQMGEEYRNNPFYGHLNFLNLVDLVQPISTGVLAGPQMEDYPINATKIDEARAQVPPTSRPAIIAAHGLGQATPADVILGKLDSVDMLFPSEYYKLLDVGLRVPLTDGADHPVRVVGQNRCYVKAPSPLTYGGWIDGILAGSSFVTSGPLMFLTVNGTDIGGEVQVSMNAPINVHVEAHARTPIGRLQIVSNDEILYDQFVAATSAVIDLPLIADESRWIAARCSDAIQPNFSPSNEPNAAHTSATYLIVDQQEIFVDSGAAQDLRDRCQVGGDFVFAQGTFHAPDPEAKRAEARDYFFSARDGYQAIIDAKSSL